MASCAVNIKTTIDQGLTQEMLGDFWWQLYHEYAPSRTAGAEYRSIIRQAFQGGYLDELNPYSVLSGDLREHHEEYLKTREQLEPEDDDGVSEADEGVPEDDDGVSEADEGVPEADEVPEGDEVVSEEDEGLTEQMLGDIWWKLYHEYAPFRATGTLKM
jgi:hypothetical protein